MKLTKVLIIFPLILEGYIIGFVCESFAIGIHAGRAAVCKMGDECAADLAKRKAA